jgi:hypothetical protein
MVFIPLSFPLLSHIHTGNQNYVPCQIKNESGRGGIWSHNPSD